MQTLFLSTKKEKKHLLPSILSKDRSSWKTWPNLSWNLKRYWKNIIHYAQVMEVRTPSLVSGLTCLSLWCTEIHFDFEVFIKSIFCKGKSNLAQVADKNFPVIFWASVTQASQTQRWPPLQISYQALMSLVSIKWRLVIECCSKRSTEKTFWFLSKVRSHAKHENKLLYLFVYYTILNRQEVTQDKKVKLHFIKCHAPWEVLLFYAEELNFRAPLEVRNIFFICMYISDKLLLPKTLNHSM